jgi:5-methylthioribose kinase
MSDEAITICDDFVIKTGSPEPMRIEIEKTRRAYRISQQCGLFQVPQVLDYDHATGIAKLEYMPGIRTLRQIMAAGDVTLSIVDKLGRSLAIIHQKLTLPKDMVIPLPKHYCFPGTEVFLHGDLGLRNVCVNQNSSQLIILDWRTSIKACEQATYGSRYFDMMWFVYNLFYRPVGRERYKSKVPAPPMARAFLQAYFRTSDYTYKQQEFLDYMLKFLDVKRTKGKKGFHFKRRLLLVPSHIKLRRFIYSFRM